MTADSTSGRLLQGDNAAVLATLPDESVDLVYLDPPFNTGDRFRRTQPRQAGGDGDEAFADQWRWTKKAEAACATLQATARPPVANALAAFERLWGPSDHLAHLVMLSGRLEELRRVLRPTGSLYLHCDAKSCHGLKLLLDAVFGPTAFLNHIVWLYGLGGSSPRRWPRKHDDLLWYAREPGQHFFEPALVPARSARLQGQLKKAPDYWDIPALNNMARERLGYPTQKPEALLERIIASSSRPGDVVLDPFCGSGTTLVVAERLGRRWIGIDEADAAMEVCRKRLAGLEPSGEIGAISDQR